jgi:hypothetical protein
VSRLSLETQVRGGLGYGNQVTVPAGAPTGKIQVAPTYSETEF